MSYDRTGSYSIKMKVTSGLMPEVTHSRPSDTDHAQLSLFDRRTVQSFSKRVRDHVPPWGVKEHECAERYQENRRRHECSETPVKYPYNIGHIGKET